MIAVLFVGMLLNLIHVETVNVSSVPGFGIYMWLVVTAPSLKEKIPPDSVE